MNVKRSIIEPNRPVDCIVIGRSPVARLAAGEPVTATLIWRSQINGWHKARRLFAVALNAFVGDM